MEPIFWCWGSPEANDQMFYEFCASKKDMRFPYTVFSMFAMFLYYLLLIDLTVISTRISAFSLVCVRMLSEVGLFLGALIGAVLTFACAISVLKQDNPDFAGIQKGAYALIRVVLGAYDAKRYSTFRDDPLVLVMALLFCILTVIFFLSMLV